MPTRITHLGEPERLRGQDAIITPHEGEFRRLFGEIDGTKPERALEAARRSGAVVVYKGPDTLVASPDGRLGFAPPAPAWLASAGTGDVLAGVIAAMRARGLPAFEAACAGVWLQGEAAEIAGPQMIADDLAEAIPGALDGACRDRRERHADSRKERVSRMNSRTDCRVAWPVALRACVSSPAARRRGHVDVRQFPDRGGQRQVRHAHRPGVAGPCPRRRRRACRPDARRRSSPATALVLTNNHCVAGCAQDLSARVTIISPRAISPRRARKSANAPECRPKS